MPGSIWYGSAAAVFPRALCPGFEQAREYPVLGNEYLDGSWQALPLSSEDRRRWKLSFRLPAALIEKLRQFYLDRQGPKEAFWFYDPWETPRFSHDPSGSSAAGRYLVRFEGPYTEAAGTSLSEASVSLIEVA